MPRALRPAIRNVTQDEAEELSLLIRGGALPVPVDVVEQRTIGPSLGEEAVSGHRRQRGRATGMMVRIGGRRRRTLTRVARA